MLRKIPEHFKEVSRWVHIAPKFQFNGRYMGRDGSDKVGQIAKQLPQAKKAVFTACLLNNNTSDKSVLERIIVTR